MIFILLLCTRKGYTKYCNRTVDLKHTWIAFLKAINNGQRHPGLLKFFSENCMFVSLSTPALVQTL